MNNESIEQQKQTVVEQYGAWTAHNIHLTGDLYTIAPKIVGDEIKLRRITQIVVDNAKKPLQDLRILDLACLEGLYGIELARQGAQVVGIEGRETNIEKARFTKEILALDNLHLVQDDVRNLSVERHGHFDVVLCLGILYHLEVPDIFTFLEQIGNVCQGFAVFDTHVSAVAERSHLYKGKTYSGGSYQEHDAISTAEQRIGNLWASLDNTTSFWHTRPSLCNALTHVGFTSVYECYMPPEPDKTRDRITLLAIKGQRQKLLCSPLMNEQPIEDCPEPIPDHADSLSKVVQESGERSRLGNWLPLSIKRQIKNLLGF